MKPTKAQERRAYEDMTTRDNNTCVRCGRYGVERDHRKNRSQGGLTVVSNLQGLCPACHRWSTEHPALSVAEGFAVPGWAHPAIWPGYRIGVGWVIYYDRPDSKGRWWSEITESTAEMLMRGGVDGT